MDRKQEYQVLLQELQQTPPRLEYTVQRAKARKKRHSVGRILGIPVIGLAGIFAAFVILVNTSIPFAMACGNVPALKELVAAVALSPSLKAAVEHNYAQYIGQSQTENGITLDLEYMILDQGGMRFFMKADGPYESYLVSARFENPDGSKLAGGAIMGSSFGGAQLNDAVSMVVSGEDIVFPERLRMVCQVKGYGQKGNAAMSAPPESVVGDRPEEGEPEYLGEFTFEFPLDTACLNDKSSIPPGDWVEVDGQRLRFSLDSFPSHGRLRVEEDEDNTAALQSIAFYLEDEAGNRFENNSANGLVAMGNTYMCDTTYFAAPTTLRLCITKVTWLEEGREFVTLDLAQGVCMDPLPQGISIQTERTGDTVKVSLFAPSGPESDEHNMHYYQISSMKYLVPGGEEAHIYEHGVHSILEQEGYFAESFTLRNCPWDTVELGMYFSSQREFQIPLEVKLT